MVYYADMPVDAYADYLSVHHKLLAAVGAEPVAIIPDHDFKKVGGHYPLYTLIDWMPLLSSLLTMLATKYIHHYK